MTFRELGACYFKTWKGKILLAVTLLAAVLFVCFFADTLALNTYIPKTGQSVIDTFYSEYNPGRGNGESDSAFQDIRFPVRKPGGMDLRRRRPDGGDFLYFLGIYGISRISD